MNNLDSFFKSNHTAATKLLLLWFKQREVQGIKNKVPIVTICQELNLSHVTVLGAIAALRDDNLIVIHSTDSKREANEYFVNI